MITLLGSLYTASGQIVGAIGQLSPPVVGISPGSIAAASIMAPVGLLYQAGLSLGIPAEWLVPAP